jgi:hypothetical protein
MLIFRIFRFKVFLSVIIVFILTACSMPIANLCRLNVYGSRCLAILSCSSQAPLYPSCVKVGLRPIVQDFQHSVIRVLVIIFSIGKED